MIDQFSPDSYEIIKFITGNEVVGMTKDRGEIVEIYIPMSYWLQPKENQTKIGFYPYTPLSEDHTINVFKSDILHRSKLSDQFIPLYDKSAQKWIHLLDSPDDVPIVDEELDAHKLSDIDYVGDILDAITGKKKGPLH